MTVAAGRSNVLKGVALKANAVSKVNPWLPAYSCFTVSSSSSWLMPQTYSSMNKSLKMPRQAPSAMGRLLHRLLLQHMHQVDFHIDSNIYAVKVSF